MFAERNKKSTVKEGIDVTAMIEAGNFHKISEYVGKTIKPVGMIFTESKRGYGRQVMLVTEDALVNMPGWCVDTFQEIANAPEELAAFKEGKCLITNITEKDTGKGNPTYIFELADAE